MSGASRESTVSHPSYAECVKGLEGHRYAALVPIDNRVTLQKLEVLQLVVELEGATRAADHLYVSQPVISGHIRSLEERLGTKIFYREGRSMHLTEAGRTVYEWASEILTRTRELERHLDGLADGSRGNVAMVSSMSLGSYEVPLILSQFQVKRPGVRIRLSIAENDRAISGTKSGDYDFAILVTRAKPAEVGMTAEEIGQSELILVASPTLALPDDPIARSDVPALPLVATPRHSSASSDVDLAMEEFGFSRQNVVIEMGHPEAIKRAVMAGLGVSMIFRNAVESELQLGLLREVRVADFMVSRPVFLIYRKDKAFSVAHLDILEELRLHFR